MAFKAELTRIVEGQQLTWLLQSILVNHGVRHEQANAFQAQSCIASTAFKDHILIFTEHGSYVDLSQLMSTIHDVIQSDHCQASIRATYQH